MLNNIKIRQLGIGLVLILLLVTAVNIAGTVLAINDANRLNETWRSYDEGPASKTAVLAELRDAIGYGGVIHQFKNYVLRQDSPRIEKVTTRLDEMAQAIAAYQALGVNPSEQVALDTIEEVFADYRAALKTASELTAEGGNPQSLDKAVKINDTPALEALATLDQELVNARNQSSMAVDSSVDRLINALFVSGSVLAGAMLLTTAGLLWFMGARLIRPLGLLSASMERLARGDQDVEIPARNLRDEIGVMADTVQVFKDNAVEMKRLQNQQQEQNLRSQEEKRRATLEMADNLEGLVKSVVDKVGNAVGGMQETANSMSQNADYTAEQANSVAAAAEQASSNVQSMASATDELASSIQEVSRQVSNVTESANDATRQAQETSQTVVGLAESAQRIGDVVSLINDIAEQTNLLALNATIEAARAGEMGKGFAVVASEVKSLASQTAKATEEIAQQIKDVQSVSGETAEAIEGVVGSIERITEQITAISGAVEEQNAVTGEIARNTQDIAQGSKDISGTIGSVSDAAGASSNSAEAVRTTLGELGQHSEKLGMELDGFLRNLRAS